ncbi:hypothetical protein B0T10DRAFT_466645 [Thelonectria olida]|uniref:Secreted LysM effector LysM C-terminal domain-containing protein n=1 Tax=Thelonectria olida TaxID=1576542 RepID=A0A9P8VR67_9HYPO|nr:hypothetical protein B0T10DRAFT_466645 [Thelonectria olida]
MRVSPSTWLVALAAALKPVAAWEFTAYDGTLSCFANGNTQYRIISGGGKSGCLTFGRDMPGTGCTKYTSGGGVRGPCDGQAFAPISILVQPDTVCMIFRDGNCQQEANVIVPQNGQPTCGNGIGLSTTIGSIICIPASDFHT